MAFIIPKANEPPGAEGWKAKKVDDVTMAVRVSSFGFFPVAARAAGKPSPHQCCAAPQGSSKVAMLPG